MTQLEKDILAVLKHIYKNTESRERWSPNLKFIPVFNESLFNESLTYKRTHFERDMIIYFDHFEFSNILCVQNVFHHRKHNHRTHFDQLIYHSRFDDRLFYSEYSDLYLIGECKRIFDKKKVTSEMVNFITDRSMRQPETHALLLPALQAFAIKIL